MANKPSYELLVLMQRAGNGDVAAFGEIWPLLFTEPLDPKRPGEDIAKDIAERFTLLYPVEEEKAEPKAPSSDDSLIELFAEGVRLIESLTKPPKGAKRA